MLHWSARACTGCACRPEIGVPFRDGGPKRDPAKKNYFFLLLACGMNGRLVALLVAAAPAGKPLPGRDLNCEVELDAQ
jgi:hypothetical protein